MFGHALAFLVVIRDAALGNGRRITAYLPILKRGKSGSAVTFAGSFLLTEIPAPAPDDCTANLRASTRH